MCVLLRRCVTVITEEPDWPLPKAFCQRSPVSLANFAVQVGQDRLHTTTEVSVCWSFNLISQIVNDKFMANTSTCSFHSLILLYSEKPQVLNNDKFD